MREHRNCRAHDKTVPPPQLERANLLRPNTDSKKFLEKLWILNFRNQSLRVGFAEVAPTLRRAGPKDCTAVACLWFQNAMALNSLF